MNVQEIIEDADLLAPNSFPISRKVRWINQVQRQLHNDIPSVFSSSPQDMNEEQLSFIPRFPVEYHELLSLGAAKRIAERNQDYKGASEIEARYQNLLLEAKIRLSPKLKKININRGWI